MLFIGSGLPGRMPVGKMSQVEEGNFGEPLRGVQDLGQEWPTQASGTRAHLSLSMPYPRPGCLKIRDTEATRLPEEGLWRAACESKLSVPW